MTTQAELVGELNGRCLDANGIAPLGHGEPRHPEDRRPLHARTGAVRRGRVLRTDDHRPDDRLHGRLHLRLQRVHDSVEALERRPFPLGVARRSTPAPVRRSRRRFRVRRRRGTPSAPSGVRRITASASVMAISWRAAHTSSAPMTGDSAATRVPPLRTGRREAENVAVA